MVWAWPVAACVCLWTVWIAVIVQLDSHAARACFRGLQACIGFFTLHSGSVRPIQESRLHSIGAWHCVAAAQSIAIERLSTGVMSTVTRTHVCCCHAHSPSCTPAAPTVSVAQSQQAAMFGYPGLILHSPAWQAWWQLRGRAKPHRPGPQLRPVETNEFRECRKVCRWMT